jgi:hypothetical protein
MTDISASTPQQRQERQERHQKLFATASVRFACHVPGFGEHPSLACSLAQHSHSAPRVNPADDPSKVR